MEFNPTEFSQMKEDIAEIKGALLGNDFNNKKGFVWIMEDHNRRLNDLEKYRDEEIIRLRYQQEKDRKTQNLIKTLLGVITILSLLWAFYKNK